MRNEFLLALSMREKGDWSGILKEMKDKKRLILKKYINATVRLKEI